LGFPDDISGLVRSGMAAQMTLYDAWIFRGPEEREGPVMEDCEGCDGMGKMHDDEGEFDCDECNGAGEIEVFLEEPDSDYLYEKARDAKWEDI
jgi:hypothetical protein